KQIIADSVEQEDIGDVAFFRSRMDVLANSQSINKKGLLNDLFFPVYKKNEKLELRKNFAFFDFDDYIEKVSQADVYFTISSILNNLRNSNRLEKKLVQEAHQRNLISPANFSRFNDGIIQASILRSARKEELAFDIDTSSSLEMLNILKSIVANADNEQGEGLLEFLFAFAIRKITLTNKHFKEFKHTLKKHNIHNNRIAGVLINHLNYD
ncbi:MAG: hypothetical protein WBG42_17860, partial [Cryomorphaceae bacterium]